MNRNALAVSIPCVLAALAGQAAAAPPFAVTSIATSGQQIADVGIVNSAFYNNNQVPACTGSRGILKAAVNNSGQWLIQTDSPTLDSFTDSALISSAIPSGQFGFVPFLVEGVDGYLTAPSFSTIAAPFGTVSNPCSPTNPFWAENTVGAIAVTNGGQNAMMLRILPSLGADPVLDASSAIYLGLNLVIARQGQPVGATGLDAGTVWGPLTIETAAMAVNASGQFLVIAPVVELGVSKRAAIVISTDGSGNVTGTTLLAKEGGPAGAGPSTWTTLSIAPHGLAINDAGSTIFSGATSGGITGLFRDGQFAVLEGDATPVPGKSWGSLLDAPLDLNNRGDFAFRALIAPGSGVWTESSPDAGEEFDGQNGLANVPGDSTFGNGPLTRIIGSLSSDHDVDLYRIRITDPANFSATTVPDPGTGFTGANFDTMLYLIREPGNGTVITQRSDDAAPGVVQSTLTGAMVPAVGDYYLAVCTPVSRPVVNQFYFAAQQNRNDPAWIEDPGFLAVGGGRVLWSDPSSGRIQRALTSTGAIQAPDAQVASPQALTIPAGQSNITGPIGVFSSGGVDKVYWIATEAGATRIRRANFDGSSPEDLITGSASISLFSSSGLAVDASSSRLFWARTLHGEIWRAAANGSNPELMLKVPDEIVVGNMVDFSCTNLAAGAGFVFWTDRISGAIKRCLQTVPAFSSDSVVQNVITGVQAEHLAVDAAAGKLYWTETAMGRIRRSNLDGSGVETFITTARPLAIALDGTNVYWSSGDDRVIRRALIAAPAATTLVTIGADLGPTRPAFLAGSRPFAGWERLAPMTPGALPYQVRLTGASPRITDVMIAKNNTQKVVATYDAVPGRAGSRITVIGSGSDAFKLSDRGDVMWRGSFFEPTIFINFFASALFLNGEAILVNNQIPPGFTDRLIFFYSGPYNIDYSKNGRWAVVSANTQVPPFNFTFQPDRALLLQFDLPPECAPDFNGDGNLDPDDLSDYITCFFTQAAFPGACLEADFNGDGNIDPDDLSDYITAFFTGC